MKTIKVLICSLLLLVVTTVQGNETEVWSSFTKITKLYPTSTTLAFFTEYKNPTYSTCDGGSRFSLDPNYSNYNIQAGALMAAFMADKEI